MKRNLIILASIYTALNLTGCQVVSGIFKAGMAWGVILVFLVIIGIIYLVSRGKGK